MKHDAVSPGGKCRKAHGCAAAGPSLALVRGKGTLLGDTLGTDGAIDAVIILSVKWQIVSREQQVMQRLRYNCFLVYSLFCITGISQFI